MPTLRLEIVNHLPMQWVEGYKKVFEEAGWETWWWHRPGEFARSNACLFMWCNEPAISFLNGASNSDLARSIVFIRRYEYYTMPLKKVPWEKVGAVIMVNDALAYGFEQRTGVKPHVIYNGVDPERWSYKVRGHGKKIAMVGYINHRKNLPLAAEIMARLPKDYELHIAGACQSREVLDFMLHAAVSGGWKAVFHGPVDNMNAWLEDKDYLLCTSVSEGCPNSVIEAMAKGIKPIVHNWPGATNQFGNAVFRNVSLAMSEVDEDVDYESAEYRRTVMERFSLDNLRKVRSVIEETVAKANS